MGMAEKEIVSMNVKKIIRWATGFAVFVTKEAKELGWNDKDQIVMTAFRDKDGDGIEIRRAPIRRKR